MKRLLLAASMLTALALPAQAHFVLADETFADLGGTGFGVLPRLLTLQTTQSGIESGAVISTGGTQSFLSPVSFSGPNGTTLTGIGCNNNNSCNPGGLSVNESNLINISTFGWTSGANVGVGLDTNQTGSTDGLQFNNLVLNIYNAAGAIVGSFGSTNPVLITPQQLADQQGNGNSVFDLRLSLDEQTTFNTMLANNPGNLFAGLAASFGCSTAGCVGRPDDGAESFLGFNTQAVPGPIVGAGIPGLIMAGLGMLGFNRARRKRLGT
jgi:hypothetical protein